MDPLRRILHLMILFFFLLGHVLELLLEFMYPCPQPDLQTLKFETAAAVAEAAEKFCVLPALSICRKLVAIESSH
jgi:hypothetical protein